MSHWTTSGRSRLKAKQKQNHSFSKRARQKATLVATAESTCMTQETLPREIMTYANDNINSQTKRRRKDEARRRYSSCNPIARRGVVVSIGSAKIYHNQHQHHADDNQIESGVSISHTKSTDSQFENSHLPCEHHLPRRRRMRDASTGYCKLNSRRTSMNYNTNLNSRHHVEAPAHPSIQYHQQLDDSFQHQPDSCFQNNEEIRDEVSNQISRRHYLSGREVDAPLSFSNEKFPSDNADHNCNPQSQLQQEWQHQTLPNIMNHQSQNRDHNEVLLPERRAQLQGIKRFQKHNTVHIDPFEGAKGAMLDATNDDSWGNIDRFDKISDTVAGNGLDSSAGKNSTAGTDDGIYCDDVSDYNHNDIINTFSKKGHKKITKNVFTHRLIDVTTESSYSQSQKVGIRRFYKSQRKRLRSEMTEEKGNESSSNHEQFNEQFDQAMISDDSEISGLTSSGQNNHRRSLRFFDESKEVSMSPRTMEKLNLNALMVQGQDKYDTANEENILMMKRDCTSKNNKIDKSPRQQIVTATSPDTDYLRSMQFENNSVRKCFY